jgi:hypothetical protein
MKVGISNLLCRFCCDEQCQRHRRDYYFVHCRPFFLDSAV